MSSDDSNTFHAVFCTAPTSSPIFYHVDYNCLGADWGAIAESPMEPMIESEPTVHDGFVDYHIITTEELQKLSNSIKTRLIILLEMRNL